MSDEDLKRQADSDWIDHTDSPYERYLELKLARAVKQRDDLLAALEDMLQWIDSVLPMPSDKTSEIRDNARAAIAATKEGEPAKQ